MTFEHLDIKQVHLFNNGVEVNFRQEILNSKHAGQYLVHKRINEVYSGILHNNDAFINLVDHSLERLLLLLLVDDFGLIRLHELLHHEMVHEERHDGAGENRTDLSYFPKSGDRRIEAAEDQN